MLYITLIITFMKTRKLLSVAFFALVFGATSFAQKTVMVGGAPMYPSKNIVENAGKLKRSHHISGGTLTAWMKGSKLYITDEKGGMAEVTIADVNQSNGVIHVIDSVVLPM